ncbi:2'-5' RNA ligase family protein [bacterium]|nr:2'-5' RNA ligase family protein [bacterium]
MTYAIELFLDPAGDAAVQSIWQQIKEAGISDYLSDSGSRPHITLAVYDTLDVISFSKRLPAFARKIEPISIVLRSASSFSGKLTTVFLSPAESDRLYSVQEYYYEYFDDMQTATQEYYLPVNWTAHCTLAVDLQNNVVSKVRQITEALLPISAALMSIGIVEFRPVKHLFCCDLGMK